MKLKTTLIAILLLAGLAFSSDAANTTATKIDTLLKQYHSYDLFNGSALVAKDGKVIYKSGIGLADMEWEIPNQPNTRFRLGSITKQFTATLVMQLVESGKLSLDDTVTKMISGYPKEKGDKITLHHLLSHTSGLPNYTAKPGFMENEALKPFTPTEFLEVFKDAPLDFEPGTNFRYSNSGYFLLGVIIERACGKPYAQVLREKILEPLEMNDSGYDFFHEVLPRRARGYEPGTDGWRNARYLDTSIPYAAGSMYGSVEDLYKWDRALMGEAVLSEASKKTMFQPGKAKFGYGWMINERKVAEESLYNIAHGGGINGFNTLISRYPKRGHLVVLFNNTGSANLGNIEKGIMYILMGQTPEQPKQPLKQLLGQYLKKGTLDQAFEAILAKRDQYSFTEEEINGFGYQLMTAKKLDAALQVFRFNVKAFPEGANTYDSLAEAYMNNGDTDKAVANYRKSLELNPDNSNARKMIEKMGSKP